MKMSVDFIAGTIWKTAIHIAIVKLKTVQDVDIVVEVFAVHYQHVFFIGNVKTSVLIAMIVNITEIRT